MSEETRRKILQVLYDGKDDPTQALEGEDLAHLLGVPWYELKSDVDMLQEDDFIAATPTISVNNNSRTYRFLKIMPAGIKYLKRPPNPGLKPIKIFISSPADVADERNTATKVIHQLGNLAAISSRYVLKVLRFEEVVPGEVGRPPQPTVDRYMMQASQADIYIGILSQRMGTPVVDETTGERFQSGTEYEFMSAYRSNQLYGRPYILLYRGMKTPPESLSHEQQEQLDKVNEFFGKFVGIHAELKGIPKTYTTLAEFEMSLLRDLDTLIDKNDFS